MDRKVFVETHFDLSVMNKYYVLEIKPSGFESEIRDVCFSEKT